MITVNRRKIFRSTSLTINIRRVSLSADIDVPGPVEWTDELLTAFVFARPDLRALLRFISSAHTSRADHVMFH